MNQATNYIIYRSNCLTWFFQEKKPSLCGPSHKGSHLLQAFIIRGGKPVKCSFATQRGAGVGGAWEKIPRGAADWELGIQLLQPPFFSRKEKWHIAWNRNGAWEILYTAVGQGPLFSSTSTLETANNSMAFSSPDPAQPRELGRFLVDIDRCWDHRRDVELWAPGEPSTWIPPSSDCAEGAKELLCLVWTIQPEFCTKDLDKFWTTAEMW